jgi:hypothetical protein
MVAAALRGYNLWVSTGSPGTGVSMSQNATLPGWPVVLVALAGACKSDISFQATEVPLGEPNPREFSTPVQVDRILQTTVPNVDVLFVVDNSCSMVEEQALLAANFPAMLEWFLSSGLDYHIGLVSTDMNDPLQAGRLQGASGVPFIDPVTEAPEVVFSQMALLGTSGHWEEKGRAAAYSAIDLLADTANAGFVREDAGMHITVVSDENDDSADFPISRDGFIDYLRNFRWSERLVSFSSIVGPITGCPDIGSPGTEYTAVTSEIGGVFWPICSDDWTVVLDDLGFLATGLSKEFFLSRLPVEETIEVRVTTGVTVLEFFAGEDWTYVPSRNSVAFLEIEYEVLSTLDGVDQPGATVPQAR